MIKKNIEKYLKLFTNLNKDNINNFDDLVIEDIVFKDPFNNVKGIKNFKKIFYHMFENVNEPKFTILDYAQNKSHVFLKWKMSFYAFKSLQIIEGMSDITFNKEGKIEDTFSSMTKPMSKKMIDQIEKILEIDS